MVRDYTAKGYWNNASLSELWDRNALARGDAEAIVDSRTRLTWGEAKLWIGRLASRFVELGLARDEMIVAQLPNCVELSLLRVACEKAGILLMQLLPALRRNDVEGILKRVEPAGVVVPSERGSHDYLGMINEIRPGLKKLRYLFVSGTEGPPDAISMRQVMTAAAPPKYQPEDLRPRTIPGTEFFLVIHTSGTTGFPKFAEHPMCSRLSTFKVLAQDCGVTSADTVSIFGPAPASYNGFGYFAAPQVGCRTVILERFDARQALNIIQKERITVLGLVPAQLQLMINEPDFKKFDLGSLRVIACMGSFLPPELGARAEETIGCTIINVYGGVDTGAISFVSSKDPPPVRFNTVGRPFPGTEIKLCDEKGRPVTKGGSGVIWARGPCLASGFYGDEQQTREVWTTDGWTSTGDIGEFDPSGNLVIKGRAKDVIIRGGQNIYPAEIESLLFTHPGIFNAAVVAMPDPVLGEKACAYVVLRDGRRFAFEELVSFLKDKDIASFKLPERLEIVDKMPIVADTQKVDKKALQEDIAAKIAAEAKRAP